MDCSKEVEKFFIGNMNIAEEMNGRIHTLLAIECGQSYGDRLEDSKVQTILQEEGKRSMELYVECGSPELIEINNNLYCDDIIIL